MTEITILDNPVVGLVDYMGCDLSVVWAAKVSVGETFAEDVPEKKIRGLINYLMANRHGTPFEHATMTFYVKAPIFVFREFHRHRIASYNEMSGRYTELPGEFYLPNENRPMVNGGTSARPEMVAGTVEQYEEFIEDNAEFYERAWELYQKHLSRGIANELARIHLPVGIYSQMYVTINLRSLMNFLSLRVDSPDAAIRTRPQYEIEQVAEQIEEIFSERFPIVHETFIKNGRVAP